MPFELVFLGTGTSAGVPMIACECPVCRSDDPRDKRTRSSVLVRYRDSRDGSLRQVLIDASPELRLQAVAANLQRLDGIVFTHHHVDHIFGLDDVRRFNAVMGGPIDIYAEPLVLDRLRATFEHIFESHRNTNASFVATLIPHAIEPESPIDLFGAIWTPLRLLHGRLPIVGYRIDVPGGGSIAYCTDVSSIPPQTYPLLRDLDVLVIDALRYRHHPTHMTVDQALSVIDQVRPRRAFLTHIAHDILHADLAPRLPDNVFLPYDGLTVTIAPAPGSAPAPGNAPAGSIDSLVK